MHQQDSRKSSEVKRESRNNAGLGFRGNSYSLGLFLHSLVDDSDLTPYEFRVYAHLCRRANDEMRVWEGQKKMAQACKMSQRQVQNSLYGLRDKGWLELRAAYREDGSQRANDIYLLGPPTHDMRTPHAPSACPPRMRCVPEGYPIEGYPIEGKNKNTSSDENQPAGVAPMSPDGDVRVSGLEAAGERQKDESLPSQGSLGQIARHETQQDAQSLEKVPAAGGAAARLLALWNEHCGSLPQAARLNAARSKKLAAVIKEFGGEAESIFADAVRCVAADPYWREQRYGLDNLLRGKVLEKAEKYRAGPPTRLARAAGRRPQTMQEANQDLMDYAAEAYGALEGFDE